MNTASRTGKEYNERRAFISAACNVSLFPPQLFALAAVVVLRFPLSLFQIPLVSQEKGPFLSFPFHSPFAYSVIEMLFPFLPEKEKESRKLWIRRFRRRRRHHCRRLKLLYTALVFYRRRATKTNFFSFPLLQGREDGKKVSASIFDYSVVVLQEK